MKKLVNLAFACLIALSVAIPISATSEVKQGEKTNWSNENGSWYVLNKDGSKLTGWYRDEYRCWYFLDYTTGAMKTGWLADGKDWYYFNPSNGIMQTGWKNIQGVDYYFAETGDKAGTWIRDAEPQTKDFYTLHNDTYEAGKDIPVGEYYMINSKRTTNYTELQKQIDKANSDFWNYRIETPGPLNAVAELRLIENEKEIGRMYSTDDPNFVPYLNLKEGMKLQAVNTDSSILLYPLTKNPFFDLNTVGIFIPGMNIEAGKVEIKGLYETGSNFIVLNRDETISNLIYDMPTFIEQEKNRVYLENKSNTTINIEEGQILFVYQCNVNGKDAGNGFVSDSLTPGNLYDNYIVGLLLKDYFVDYLTYFISDGQSGAKLSSLKAGSRININTFDMLREDTVEAMYKDNAIDSRVYQLYREYKNQY